MSAINSFFAGQLAVLNRMTRDQFGTELITYQPYTATAPLQPRGAAVKLKAVPLDPIRLEGKSSGQFTVRWVQAADFAAYTLTPRRGDRVTITANPTTSTIGGTYVVNQVQADEGGGVRLLLILMDNRTTGVEVPLQQVNP